MAPVTLDRPRADGSRHTGPVSTPPHHPERQVRAAYDDTTITVYQAYAPAIADAALSAGTFVAPFSLDRMTWIKPSFTWMMYRSGWATKPGQERVLAIRMRRDGFAEALDQSCLSHFAGGVHASHEAWLEQKVHSPVRVQWDPERDAGLNPLPYRAIQIGLSGSAARDYVDRWIVAITDVTTEVHRLAELDVAQRAASLPVERPYPLPAGLASRVNAS